MSTVLRHFFSKAAEESKKRDEAIEQEYALTNALMAKMPFRQASPRWRGPRSLKKRGRGLTP